ncbi:hypothetical protein LWI29_038391 [Acer saccharum]|uniref:Uncharacterized protein n=1 Tax=Acer saccharum TaxID=4024 RepID=A0AA39RUA8_ACESA|nr:hypothetical protein LWI29_038391 [Acer saccharum]
MENIQDVSIEPDGDDAEHRTEAYDIMPRTRSRTKIQECDDNGDGSQCSDPTYVGARYDGVEHARSPLREGPTPVMDSIHPPVLRSKPTPVSFDSVPAAPLVLSPSSPCLAVERSIRMRKRGWQLNSPCTDPCKPKMARIRAHKFQPLELLDDGHIGEYKDFKKNLTTMQDVDLETAVGVLWFKRLDTCNMDTFDTHLDAYLQIIQKRQRAYPVVYDQRTNILDTQYAEGTSSPRAFVRSVFN